MLEAAQSASCDKARRKRERRAWPVALVQNGWRRLARGQSRSAMDAGALRQSAMESGEARRGRCDAN